MQQSTRVIIISIVIVLIVLGGWYLIANHNKTNNGHTAASSSNSTMNMSNNNSSNSHTQSSVATNAVTIQNFAFSPTDISIKAGTSVTWTNKDSVTHTVTETDGQTGPNSSDVSPNGTYTFTFTKAGTYHYHCSIHTEMVGTVTVTG